MLKNPRNSRRFKDVVAKLMAGENFRVIHDPAESVASFDIKSRVLTMPRYSNVSDAVNNMLIGHEVGHALYTPSEEYWEMVKQHGDKFRTFLNVVEDARVDRLIKIKYPGLKSDYTEGYKSLYKLDFFQCKNKSQQQLNDMLLIDRLSVCIKVGQYTSKMQFRKEEEVFLQRLENIDTWEDSVNLALDLYEYCKTEHLKPKLITRNKFHFQNYYRGYGFRGSNVVTRYWETEDWGDWVSGHDEDSEDAWFDRFALKNYTPEDFIEGEEEEEEKDFTPREVESEVDVFYNESLQALATGEGHSGLPRIQAELPVLKKDSFVDSYEKVLVDARTAHTQRSEYYKKGFFTFKNQIKPIVNKLVQEFDRKKKAHALRNIQVSKSGKLNPAMLHRYKTHEDIFLRNIHFPDGKSHGMLMLVDLSGSMSNHFLGTVQQLMTLVYFCRKTNIPFKVYGFHNSKHCVDHRYLNHSKDFFKYNDFGFREYFTPEMKTNEVHMMAEYLYTCAMGADGNPHEKLDSGTPLNQSILATRQLAVEFQNKYGFESLTTIFLTDGENTDSPISIDHEVTTESGNTCKRNCDLNSGIISLYDPVCHAHWDVPIGSFGTSEYLKYYKKAVGGSVLGFFITSPNYARREVSTLSDYFGADERKAFMGNRPLTTEYLDSGSFCEDFDRERFLVVDGAYNYDRFFVVAGGSNLQHREQVDYDRSDLKSFLVAKGSNIRRNKVMVNKLIELIA